MSKIAAFVQVQDKPGIAEVEIEAPATFDHIRHALKGAGVEIDEETALFIDEHEEPLHHGHKEPVGHLRPGSCIHVTHCKKVKVRVHFQDKTIDRAFPPGAKVRAVKQWAVHELKLNHTDAGEHVLQLCGSTKQPPTDTALAELTDGRNCEVCFDLVPEKRVEG
ncbi:hypothetical protein AUC68_05180 [Methyloceanibacter methanicus]|uniref:Ubiquitin-like domain-containing protein n=1 Tax=Methyloceanibacter methanicus TaxID=1774968 RepID=A0A1E3W0L9_9HYPH|nr:hypothetical protein [Methyloceanibacter methanicus]ODR99365.1 hypothetical protein AUC68_05180 [Methyloceanibacter methanicus]